MSPATSTSTSISPAVAVEDEEQRLRALLCHLQAEAAVLERVTYKNKNQHRRAAYFQYLLKVRRDLKLLRAANLSEIFSTVLPVAAGRKPAQAAVLPVRKDKKKPGGKYSYLEKLLGVARLLSQMAEPVMKAAIQISLLLGKSFFMGFSTMVLALLARIRVLIQQMLLDVVSVFNKVSDLAHKKHSVKLTQGGVEAFREYYPPTSGDARIVLECTWVQDKFVLLERQHRCQNGQDMDQKSLAPEALVQYETVGLFTEEQCLENPLVSEKSFLGKSDTHAMQPDACLTDQSEKVSHDTIAIDSESEMHLVNKSIPPAASDTPLTSTADLAPCPRLLKMRPDNGKKVAFVSVRNPKSAASETSSIVPNKRPKLDLISNCPAEPEDPLGTLLGSETTDTSIF